jgi:UrcA family protein
MDTSTAAAPSARAVRLVTLTLAAGAFSFLGTVAMAGNSSANDPQPTVTVKAPRVIHRSVGNGGGLAVEQLSLTRKVSFADLNLDTPQGRAALHDRIRARAKQACQQLESLYPSLIWIDDVQSCVHHAMLTWMPQVHAVPAVATD